MKRAIAIVVVLAFVFVLPLAAQDVALAAGPKAGLNIGFVTGSDWDDQLDIWGADNAAAGAFAGGGFLEIGIAEQFGVQPELLFFQEKSRAEWEIGGEDATTTGTTNTFQIPILAKGMFSAGPGAFFGVAGPTLSFVLGDVESETEVDGDEQSTDADPDNSALFGIAVGAGYELPAGPGFVTAEARYTRNLNSAFEDELEEAYSNTVSTLLGYGVGF